MYKRQRNVLLGALLGALLACAVITVQFILDDKIKSTDDIMKYAGTVSYTHLDVYKRQKRGRRSS